MKYFHEMQDPRFTIFFSLSTNTSTERFFSFLAWSSRLLYSLLEEGGFFFLGWRTFISNFSGETVERNRVTVKTSRRDHRRRYFASLSDIYIYIHIYFHGICGVDWTSIGGLYRIRGKIKGERDGKVAGRFLAFGEGQRPRLLASLEV